jgi:hypothetical protein
MANLIVKASEFAPATQMIYGKPSVNKKGGKSINILNSTTKKWLTLHAPMMLTYGVMQRVNDDGTTTYDMSLQFPRDEFANKDTQDLKEVMAEMEEKIIQDAFTNSRDWFGKKYNSIDVLRELWTPMLKYPKNKEDGSLDTTRAPTIKVKLPIYKNKDGSDDPKFDLFDLNSRCIYPNESGETPDLLVQKGSNVCCVITCGGIWFASGKFGVTWKLNQAMVKPPDTFEKGKCYVSLGAESKPDAYDSDGETEMVSAKKDAIAPVTSSVTETVTNTDPVESDTNPKEEVEAPKSRRSKNITPVIKYRLNRLSQAILAA